MCFAGAVRIDFQASAAPTIGVEWELALVDRASRDLSNTAVDLLAAARPRLPDPARLHQELLRNTVEVVTGVCPTVRAAADDLRGTLEVVLGSTDAAGGGSPGCRHAPLRVAGPQQQLSAGHRYEELINRTQWWGRQMLIWGVHVHVGMPDRERVIPVLTSMLNHYPHLLALSASSPLWAGTDTGYASNRALMFQQLPTAGLPFQFSRWEEYERFAEDQTVTGVIDTLSEIRWDVRPASHLGTLENRVCDGVSDLRDLAALVALVQCLVVDLDTRARRRARRCPRCRRGTCRRTSGARRATAWTPSSSSTTSNAERLVTDDLADLLERLAPVGRAPRLRRRAGLGRRRRRARGVLPAAAPGGRAHRRRPGRAVVDSVVAELPGSL